MAMVRTPKTRWPGRVRQWLVLLAGAALVSACGSPPKRVDTESIRRNADDADRDLDRESDKHKDD
jgi:hypothetical protein